MRQLAWLQRKEDGVLHNNFIRAQELTARLEQAGEQLSEPLLNAMVHNGLPQCYEHFVVQESVKTTGRFVDLRTRITNNEKAACTGREWMTTIDMLRWPPSKPSPSTCPEGNMTKLLCWVALTKHACDVAWGATPEISAIREIQLSALTVKRKVN